MITSGFVRRAILRANTQDRRRNLQYPVILVNSVFLPIDLPKETLCTVTPLMSSCSGTFGASDV